MAKNVFSIIDGLMSDLGSLRKALSPLAAFIGISTASAAAPAAAPRARAKKRRAKRAGRKAAAPAAAAAAPSKKARRKMKPASPQLRAMRAQQGKYMGLLRSLNKRQQAQIKKVRAEKGYAEALDLAEFLGKKK